MNYIFYFIIYDDPTVDWNYGHEFVTCVIVEDLNDRFDERNFFLLMVFGSSGL